MNPGFGLPATGRRFAYQQMHIVRIDNDGKATEHWAVRDDASLMRQLTGSPHQPSTGIIAPTKLEVSGRR